MVILCADDDLGIQRFVLNVLKADGHTVLTAGDGAAALEASRSFSGSIDLVLTDVVMPKMDGLELWSNIKTERPGIKVLMMSGALAAREQASMAGLPILQKPFTPRDLRASVETVLGSNTSSE